MLTISDSVRRNAKRALKLRDDGYAGGTATGVARAMQLANNETIEMYDAMKMRAWFARHIRSGSYEKYVSWKRASLEDRESHKNDWRGAIAWLLWGGTSACQWILGEEMQDEIVKWGTSTGRNLVYRVSFPSEYTLEKLEK